MANPINVGTAVVFTIKVTDSETGNATDPESVIFHFIRPDSTFVSFSDSDEAVTNPAVGEYKVTYAPDMQGTWTQVGETVNPDSTKGEKFPVEANPRPTAS